MQGGGHLSPGVSELMVVVPRRKETSVLVLMRAFYACRSIFPLLMFDAADGVAMDTPAVSLDVQAIKVLASVDM